MKNTEARLAWLSLLAAVALGCGTKDPLAAAKKAQPGGREYVPWKNYVLVRYTVDEEGTEPGVLLQRQGGAYSVIGKDQAGFHALTAVLTFIPELDESGTRAFDLH
jgi:hypothetical protein